MEKNMKKPRYFKWRSKWGNVFFYRYISYNDPVNCLDITHDGETDTWGSSGQFYSLQSLMDNDEVEEVPDYEAFLILSVYLRSNND